MKRHEDAIFTQGGACNMLAVTNSLLNAIREVRAAGGHDHQDEAVRLIVHQLYYLAKVGELDEGIAEYERCMSVCEKEGA